MKNLENTLSEHQKLRKKIRKFSLKTAEAKKKNKKKTGSNVEKLRKLEPQQKQRVLIKSSASTQLNSSFYWSDFGQTYSTFMEPFIRFFKPALRATFSPKIPIFSEIGASPRTKGWFSANFRPILPGFWRNPCQPSHKGLALKIN